MTTQQLPFWLKNMLLTIGIIVFNWVLPFSIFAVSTTDIPREYQIQFHANNLFQQLNYPQLKQSGIKKIIYRVFDDTESEGGLFFLNSQFKPRADYLQRFYSECHSNHFSLCAWMSTRKFTWVKDPLLFDTQFDNGSAQTIPKLDMFNPHAIQIIITVFKELAQYPVDSILIQDDFMIRYNEGFSQWGKSQFTRITGVPAKEKSMMEKNTPYYRAWNRIKCNQICNILTHIIKTCKQVHPSLKIGMNIHYETPVFPERGEAWYAHRLSSILDTGIDYIYLMAYHRQIKEELNLTEDANRTFFKDMINKAYSLCGDKLVVKMQIRDWNTGDPIPSTELHSYLALIPPQIKHICFTPTKIEDTHFLNYITTPLLSNPISFNPKSLEVQEPFFRKVPGKNGGTINHDQY